MSKVKITFQPSGITISVPSGITIKDASILAGIIIDSPCGGESKCGKCRVQVKTVSDAVEEGNTEEKKLLTLQELKRGVRLACQTKISQDIIVFIPKNTYVDRKKSLIKSVEKKYPLNPHFKKPYPNYGLALDIGTTSVVGVLVDLVTGKELAIVSEANIQSIYGADVISRINYAVGKSQGLSELQRKIIEVINKIIGKLSAETSVRKTDINDVTVVGNTVMQHLLLGISVQSLATLPFEPACKSSVDVKAKELRIDINPEANIYVFPNIAGFIGGDIVGVILALGLHHSKEINLAVDIGTNGEIVLGSKGKIICTSTAAGPAFEGAHITYGMRAVDGAIESVYIAEEGVFLRTIGHIPAEGICGSGLIDTVAELLKFGIVDETGRLRDKNDPIVKKLSPVLSNSLRNYNEQSVFYIAENKSDTKNVFLSQDDIRELQLAKGAIYTGIQILKNNLGVGNNDINRLFIAGTFGNYIDRKNAQIIGLIPNMSLEKVVFVGNAALEGAKLALISRAARKEIEKISQMVEYVDISSHSDFNSEFAHSMVFWSVL